MKKFIRSKLCSFIFNDVKTSVYFYNKYQGGRSLSFIKKILIPLLDLKTLKDFILFHNHPLILSTFGKSVKQTRNLNSTEQNILDELKREGIVFLNGYFNSLADNFITDNIENINSADNNYIMNNEVTQSDELFQILNDATLINVASEYYGTQAYYRYRPVVNLTNPQRDEIESRQKVEIDIDDNFADDWHIDSVYNLQYHILLDDVANDGTRMLFAKGPKVKFFERFCGYASDEYVKNNFSITDCVGKKGTVILFDGSLHWHKLCPVKGRKRLTTSVLFTRGQQPAAQDEYVNRLRLDKLSKATLVSAKYIT